MTTKDDLGVPQRSDWPAAQKLPDDYLIDPESRAGVQDRLEECRKWHDATGCRCRGRSDSHVNQTLRNIGRVAPHLSVYQHLQDASSVLVHQAMWDVYLREVEPVLTDVHALNAGERASRLGWLLQPYGIGVTMILEYESANAARAMNRSLRTALADTENRRALASDR